MVLSMKIIVQRKEVDKYTRKVTRKEVSLDNDNYDGNNFVCVVIGGRVVAELLVADLYTAVEAFQRHAVRDDEEQARMAVIDRGQQ